MIIIMGDFKARADIKLEWNIEWYEEHICKRNALNLQTTSFIMN
jgi:hypothetical protein